MLVSMSAIKKTISWSLITAILLVTFLPSHYHMHHLYNESDINSAAQHGHVVDLHVLSEQVGDAHHDEAVSFTASPDGVLNRSNPDFPLFVFLVAVLLLLPMQSKLISVRPIFRSFNFRQRYLHFTPLLRAPPLR